MSKDIYTKIIGRLAKNCMGIHYAYLNQSEADSDGMKRDLDILGPFKGKDGNPWNGGICFGLSAIYLGCRTPTGKRTWPKSEDIMNEFDAAIKGQGGSTAMLTSIAAAFVRQKGASIIHKGDITNPKVRLCKGCGRQYPLGLTMSECMRCGSKNLVTETLRQQDVEALARLHRITPEAANLRRFEKEHDTVRAPAQLATLSRYRAKEATDRGVRPELDGRSDPHVHAIRDHLVANFSLKPDPRHASNGVRQNYRTFTLDLASGKEFGDHKNHFEESQTKALVDFIGKKGTYSLIGYEWPMVAGHQMAATADGSRLHFFDPNFGVVSFSFHTGMTTFLSRALPFFYLWKGQGGQKSSTTFMSQSVFGQNQWTRTQLDLEVYRYST